MERIHFYRVNDRYGEFSNFAPCPIELNGRHWPTSEHYFQAQKFALLMELRAELRQRTEPS
jgi:N-glycosidase YbiA